jgi:hypothetical protein
MNIEETANKILHPHAAMIGGIMGAHGANLSQKLDQLIMATVNSGRPEFTDKWQYNQFSFAGAGGPQEFATPVVIPQDEVWLVQVLIVEAAASIIIATDGGQLRGSFTPVGANTLSLSGNIAWLPGEHILITSTAAVTGTVGVIRKQMPSIKNARQAIGPQGNEMVSGRSNTHDPARDNLDQRGIYTEPLPETRAGEGMERSTEPSIPFSDSRETTQAPLQVLDPTAP